MMDMPWATTFQGTVQWVLQQGYALLFILMLLEGPAVTAAGAFAAAVGYFHLWTVFILSIVANLIPDAVYYAIGYWGRERLINKYGHYFGLTQQRIDQAEKLAHQHSGKSLIAIKMIPFLATPGLIIVGASKMNIKKYAWWSIAITLPTSLFYLIVGYYFGAAYATIEHYLHIGIYFIIFAIAAIVLLTYLQRRYAEKYLERYDL